ncbi:GPI transamidase component PIG-T [Catenaria anguillulae PL171]|uniref:GPI transamidase component PIG-T n=1 Tax=Catenaria anguillulae PL171 TaxID=765915 RepID=A0A1Y2HXJ1_9FUNG|nr:GPI transamidase component PIG-T [Catenaria anguillulae PL171]
MPPHHCSSPLVPRPRRPWPDRSTAISVPMLACVCVVVLAFASMVSPASRYKESLSIDTLPDGKLLLAFDFVSTRPFDGPNPSQAAPHQPTFPFPRTLAQVLDQYQVEAMDLTLTQGRWQYRRWGVPAEGRGAPSGADLRVWLRSANASDTAEYVSTYVASRLDTRWLALTNALSGLFCGSLNFLDQTMTTTPKYAWADLHVSRPNVSTTLRHGALAREAVCTENLTPWAKLLPCGTRQGIARLLNGYRVFDANFNSIQARVRSECIKGKCVQYLEQAVVLVLDPMRGSESPDWSLVGLLDRSLEGACALDSLPTEVYVRFPEGVAREDVKLFPADEYRLLDVSGRRFALFELEKQKLDLRMEYAHPEAVGKQYRQAPSTASPLLLSRTTTGSNLDSGTLHLTTTNPTAYPIPLTLYQTLPWFLRTHLHTMRVMCNGTQVRPRPWRHQHALDRARPTVMELGWTVPAGVTCEWQVDFEKAFLHFTEHRPDAHRGFEIPAALVTFPSPRPTGEGDKDRLRYYPTTDEWPMVVRMYTDIAQVQLPTPDFSMPYNVITFTCTVVAFYFGTVFALTVNRVFAYRMVETGQVDRRGNKVVKPKVVTMEERVAVAVERIKRERKFQGSSGKKVD